MQLKMKSGLMIYLRHLKFNTIQITTPGSEKNVQLQIVISEKLYTTGELPKDLSENVLILKRKKNRLQELQISKSDTRAIKINYTDDFRMFRK